MHLSHMKTWLKIRSHRLIARITAKILWCIIAKSIILSMRVTSKPTILLFRVWSAKIKVEIPTLFATWSQASWISIHIWRTLRVSILTLQTTTSKSWYRQRSQTKTYPKVDRLTRCAHLPHPLTSASCKDQPSVERLENRHKISCATKI